MELGIGLFFGVLIGGLFMWWRTRPTPEPPTGVHPYQVKLLGGKVVDFPRTPEGYAEARALRKANPGSWLHTRGDA
jgi:hypothetical protein